MSPVSRGRKPKKASKRTNNSPATSRQRAAVPGSALAAMDRWMGRPERPAWFDPAIDRVLDNAAPLATACGPRELEQLVAQLLGAELHRAVHDERNGLWLGWWFSELVDATTKQITATPSDPAIRLLHGLAALASPARQLTPATLRRARKAMAAAPDWLADVPRIAATGEVFRMRDAYGSRFAVIAGFARPRQDERSVFLFDIDASGFVTLAGAGDFDDLDQAAAAWRGDVGPAAEHARPEPVEDVEQLRCLVQCDTGDEHALMGDEPRHVLDNWFWAPRRIHELGAALRKRRTPLPTGESLYHDLDPTAMTEPFIAWYATRHGSEPDPETVEVLAGEWMEGTLPETWFTAAPGRVAHQLSLIGDWVPDHPITRALPALLPEWVQWLTERTDLPEYLRPRSLALARSAVADARGLPRSDASSR